MTRVVTRLMLVRHGRARDVDGRCIGHTDVSLSDRGAAEIRQLASSLTPLAATVDRLISSDLSRARQSADIIADIVRRPIEVDPRLRELSFGDWDGRSWADIERDDRARYEAWMAQWLTQSPPNGETVADLDRRAGDWLATIRGVSQTLIVVSHAGWIRAALTRMLGRQLEAMFELPVDYARVTVVDVTTGGATLVASNSAGID